MTPQEVKKKLWLLRNKYECLTYQEAEKISISNAEFVEALDMAIKALEKQIPKKPKIDMCENPICPRCEVPYITDECDVIYEFCPCCGQHIDWSDNNGD